MVMARIVSARRDGDGSLLVTVLEEREVRLSADDIIYKSGKQKGRLRRASELATIVAAELKKGKS